MRLPFLRQAAAAQTAGPERENAEADHGRFGLGCADALPRCPDTPGAAFTCTCGRVYTATRVWGRQAHWYRRETEAVS